MNRLQKDFYLGPAPELAPKLIGKLLCRNVDGETVRCRVTETEAYFGEDDTACHAHKGKTPRTKILYEEGGVAYVYLCYGIHSLLNIVAGERDFPQAVLIRGIEGYSGPGRLTRFLQINRALNGEDLVASSRLWLEDDGFVPKVTASKRVGIDYATPEYRDKLWRFILIEN